MGCILKFFYMYFSIEPAFSFIINELLFLMGINELIKNELERIELGYD